MASSPIKFASAVDFMLIPALNLVVPALGTAPGSPVDGLVYYDTGLTKLRARVNSAWVNLDNIPAASTIVDSMVSASAAIAESKLNLASDAAAGTASRRTLGTSSTQAFPGNGSISSLAAATGDLSLNSHKITSLTDPSSAQDAATKQYVDNARAGIAGVKDPVRVAATTNISISSAPSTIDGVTMAANDRVLLTAQTTTTQKGIYKYVASGSAMAFATDADSTGEILDGTVVAVAEGTGAGSSYIQTATPSGAPGAWSQVWTPISTGGTTYTASGGITLTGSNFTLDNVTVARGGTGATDAAGARTNLGVTGGLKYHATVAALTAGTGLDITHSLGTSDVHAMFRDSTTGAQVMLSWLVKDTNTITATSDVAVTGSALTVTVLG